jgi:hypothetical protein
VLLSQTTVLKNINTLQCETAVCTTDYPATAKASMAALVSTKLEASPVQAGEDSERIM